MSEIRLKNERDKDYGRMEAVIFDVDGTLLDTMPIWSNSGATYLKSIDVEPEEKLGEKLFTMTTDGGAEYLKATYGLNESLQEIKEGITAIVSKAYRESADFKPGAKELLDELKKRKIPMIVASSTESHLLKIVLGRLGVLDYFEDILSCGDLKTTKNEPDIFYKAVEVMGSEIKNTWIFEDGLYAIKTGVKEGFKIVGVYDKVSLKDQEDIKSYSDIYVNELTELEII